MNLTYLFLKNERRRIKQSKEIESVMDESKDKTLIITGASLGMGRELALLLAREHGIYCHCPLTIAPN